MTGRPKYGKQTPDEIRAVVEGPTMERKKNLCAKTRPFDNPYEIWESRDGSWQWRVLKKWQADDDKPNARWFCAVVTPYTGPMGDWGDVWVCEIKQHATRIK